MSEARCETCRWWSKGTDRHATGQPVGTCRRRSPILSTENPALWPMRGRWPETHTGHWCGEHSPKEEGR